MGRPDFASWSIKRTEFRMTVVMRRRNAYTPDRRGFFLEDYRVAGGSAFGTDWEWRKCHGQAHSRQGECVVGVWTMQQVALGM